MREIEGRKRIIPIDIGAGNVTGLRVADF